MPIVEPEATLIAISILLLLDGLNLQLISLDHLITIHRMRCSLYTIIRLYHFSFIILYQLRSKILRFKLHLWAFQDRAECFFGDWFVILCNVMLSLFNLVVTELIKTSFELATVFEFLFWYWFFETRGLKVPRIANLSATML